MNKYRKLVMIEPENCSQCVLEVMSMKGRSLKHYCKALFYEKGNINANLNKDALINKRPEKCPLIEETGLIEEVDIIGHPKRNSIGIPH